MEFLRRSEDRIGVLVTRGLPHIGHDILKLAMLRDNACNVIIFGSADKPVSEHNPFTPEQKARAQKIVWGDQFEIIQAYDLGALDDPKDWTDYLEKLVFDRLGRFPTDIYGGSKSDLRWYNQAFGDVSIGPGMSRGIVTTFGDWDGGGDCSHIIDRNLMPEVSASAVRASVKARTDDWKALVAPQLHGFVEEEYPPALRDPLIVEEADELRRLAQICPIHTRAEFDGMKILRADRKWRAFNPDEAKVKSLGD